MREKDNKDKRSIRSEEDFFSTIRQPAHFTAGFPIGIIAIDLVYPKLPGNVVNATTFSFPVMYEKVAFEIEELFRGDGKLEAQVISAAKKLEAEGVRAIAGACGFFAHFQKSVREAVSVPVYLSSLCQLPLIKTGLHEEQKIAVVAASGESITEGLLSQVGGRMEDIEVFDVGGLESFGPIRRGRTELDNAALAEDLCRLGEKIRRDHKEIGAILLECSDLPPYAWIFQEASGLPVYDFISLINWAHAGVCQRPYFGEF